MSPAPASDVGGDRPHCDLFIGTLQKKVCENDQQESHFACEDGLCAACGSPSNRCYGSQARDWAPSRRKAQSGRPGRPRAGIGHARARATRTPLALEEARLTEASEALATIDVEQHFQYSSDLSCLDGLGPEEGGSESVGRGGPHSPAPDVDVDVDETVDETGEEACARVCAAAGRRKVEPPPSPALDVGESCEEAYARICTAAGRRKVEPPPSLSLNDVVLLRQHAEKYVLPIEALQGPL